MGIRQEDLWWLMIETDEQILVCQKCLDEHNATRAVTGKSRRISLNFAPNGLIEYLATKHSVEQIPW